MSRSVGYWVLAIVLPLLLAGCASSPESGGGGQSSSRYSISQDRAPSGDFDASGLEDAVPRYEKPSSYGNKSPYTVWGKQYTVLADGSDYIERGTASWYGEKFHGHKTSNGEVFDMYEMTAAHRSLPLPSYARVTNLDNGRSTIVRVNDRGPFHSSRIIDLSYAAARKLGYQKQGTAHVEVAAITVSPDGSMSVAGTAPAKEAAPATSSAGEGLFVQVASFTQADSARRLSEQLRALTDTPVRIYAAGQYHRVQVGPFEQRSLAEETSKLIEQDGLGRPIVVTDPL